LSFIAELFDRAKHGPAWLRAPLRAAWRGWKRIAPATVNALHVAPRTILRFEGERRVLGIWHFQEHAGYLGDMVDFLQILNVVRSRHRMQKIDLCYIDDPSNPNRPISRDRLEASSQYKEMMLTLRAVLPGVGGVCHFDSDADFERFFRSNYHRYVCWPRYRYLHTWPSHIDYSRISDRGYPFPNVFTPLDQYFAAYGEIPMLTCPPPLLDWAREFVADHVSPAIPIALQIRFNPDSPVRNTDIAPWKTFLERMQKRSDLKFIIICRREEIIPELRRLGNVVYSKDYASGVLHDLAVLQVCHLSLFPDAGFVTYPWWTGLPTIYFGREKHEFPERRYNNENGQGLKLLNRFQRRRFGQYDADRLEQEFESLFNQLAAAGWRNPYRC
jgi:hypothetical protein